MSATALHTKEGTDIRVREQEGYGWVDVNLIGGGFGDGGMGSECPDVLSLTAKEARTIADALLSASQRLEDREPHHNC